MRQQMQLLQYSAPNRKTLDAGLAVSSALLFFAAAFTLSYAIDIFTLPHLLTVAVVGCGFMLFYLWKVGYWCMPFFMFQATTATFFIGGFAVHQLRQYFYFTLTSNMDIALEAFLIIIVSANLSYYFFGFLMRNLPTKPVQKVFQPRDLDPRMTLLLATAIIMISYISAYILFGGFRSAPLFSEEIDIARSALRESRGYLWFGLFSAYHSVNLIFATMLNSRRHIVRDAFLFSMLLVAGFPLILYGGRSVMVIPLLIAAFFYARAKQIKPTKIIIFGLIVFVTAILIYGTYREHNKRISFSAIEHQIYTDTFSEVRTLGLVDELMGPHERETKRLYSFLAATFPKAFFSVIGLNKEDYYLSLGMYVSSFDPHSKENQGYRVTLPGEIRLLHGYKGTVVWGLVLGFLFLLLDSACNRRIRGANLYNYNAAYLIVLPMAAVPYGSTFISTIVWLLGQLVAVNLVLRYVRFSRAMNSDDLE
jgi:hypothetical protein